MNKFFKKALITGVFAFSLISTVAPSARSIGDLNNFTLPRWMTVVHTEYFAKSITNAPWVLNISSLSGATSVDTYLGNSDLDRRSDYVVVSGGRIEIPSWGQAGYEYCAVLMNSKSSYSNGYISGSWSPDNQ